MTLRVLLVDDTFESRDFFQWLLSEWGCSVTTAANGFEALQLIRNAETPNYWDALVTDYQMPGMDGVTLLEKLATDPRPPCFRLAVLISGHGCVNNVHDGPASFVSESVKERFPFHFLHRSAPMSHLRLLIDEIREQLKGAVATA